MSEIPNIEIDISLGLIPFEEDMVDRALRIELDGFPFRVATPEDLFVMKVLANRPKDQLDLLEIVKMTPSLDEAHIMKHVREMAEALELPEMVLNAERLLKKT